MMWRTWAVALVLAWPAAGMARAWVPVGPAMLLRMGDMMRLVCDLDWRR